MCQFIGTYGRCQRDLEVLRIIEMAGERDASASRYISFKYMQWTYAHRSPNKKIAAEPTKAALRCTLGGDCR
jgi:hypothetical protein